MSNWINAAGEIEGSSSTLVNRDLPSAPRNELGDGGGWESTGFGPTKHNPSSEYQARANDDESGGVMATVRSPQGSPIMTRIPNGKDIVMYQGLGIPLNVAAQLGIVVRNPDGSFSDKEAPAVLKDPTAETKAKAPADKAEEKKAEENKTPFGEAAHETLQELVKGQQPGNLFKSLDSVLHTGDVDTATIERMASQAGVEPAEMRAKVETVWQGAYDAGTDILADAGIEDADAFQAFISSDLKRKGDFTEAARNFFLYSKPEGLQTMAEAYLPAMDRYEGARVKAMLTEAGWQFADRPGGGINVIVNGTPVSWEVAVKQKIITFSRG